MQKTLKKSFKLAGIGLHLGERAEVEIKPAENNSGRYFVRLDLPEQPQIPATIQSLSSAVLSTELSHQGAQVRTVEHLLAALVGLGVDNARIEITGAEVPLLDGSAWPWVKAVEEVGLAEQTDQAEEITITEPIWVRKGEAFVAALPTTQEKRFSYGIDFPYPSIGNQWYSWSPAQESFSQAIAPARTFGFADQIEELRLKGLIKGGSLENALVCDQEKWLNPPLRFFNEPVRHKLLDLMGDLSLLGRWPKAHIIAYRASHQLHLELARQISEAASVTQKDIIIKTD